MRNAACWLAIFFVLGLIYKNLDTDNKTNLFSSSVNQNQETTRSSDQIKTDESEGEQENTPSKGDQGFSPPRE